MYSLFCLAFMQPSTCAFQQCLESIASHWYMYTIAMSVLKCCWIKLLFKKPIQNHTSAFYNFYTLVFMIIFKFPPQACKASVSLVFHANFLVLILTFLTNILIQKIKLILYDVKNLGLRSLLTCPDSKLDVHFVSQEHLCISY